MNKIQCKSKLYEIFSLDKNSSLINNNSRSVENCFTTANHKRSLWIFYAYQNLTAFLSAVAFLLGWKVWKYPIPHAVVVAVFELPAHPIFRVLFKPSKGNYNMTTSKQVLSHSLAVLTAEYEHYNAMHANNPYMGYADRANAIYNAIQALKQSDSTNTQPKHQNALQRIWGAFVRLMGGEA